MTTKHTPGPWNVCMVDSGASDDEIASNVGGCTVNICAVFGAMEYSEATLDGKNEPRYEVTAEEAEANARLIAAAPELLAAVKTALHLLRTYCDPESLGGERFDLTDALPVEPLFVAIAKATSQ